MPLGWTSAQLAIAGVCVAATAAAPRLASGEPGPASAVAARDSSAAAAPRDVKVGARSAPADAATARLVRRRLERAACPVSLRPTLAFISGSSVKREQVTGDCDWVAWDATLSSAQPACNPTASQTASRADVLGAPIGASFEDNGKLVFLFADTIGATTGNGDENPYYPTWTRVQNTYKWAAGDPVAWSTTGRAEEGLLVNFFMDGNHALAVKPPPQPGGQAVDMGPDDFPTAGINLDGQTYLTCMTGTVSSAQNGGTGADYSADRSVLVQFDESAQTFASGRTVSTVAGGGHFVFMGLHEAQPAQLENPALAFGEPAVVMFGVGTYWKSNIYLSVIPKSEFWSGSDQQGAAATRYFAGLDGQGNPTWSASESAAVPVIQDVDPAKPTIGNFSVIYSPALELWLVAFSGGLNGRATTGLYLTYAPRPWGPWSTPQLMFNDCRDHGLGDFIRYYYKTSSVDFCPGAMAGGPLPAPAGAGPAGPTIGPQSQNDPQTMVGGGFSPQMIERFTEFDGNTLKLFYNMSTWNPYAVVLMESDFAIACAAGS